MTSTAVHVDGFSDQPKAIAGASIVQGTAVIDTATPPKIHFYGADPKGGLWVLHQTAWDANDAPVWAPLLPLDKDVATVASPQSALAAATLFAAGADQTLHVLTQNHGNKIWRRTLVQQPGKTPYSLTRYRTQLMVRDVYGNPARGSRSPSAPARKPRSWPGARPTSSVPVPRP